MAQRRVRRVAGNDQRSNRSHVPEIQRTSASKNSTGRGPDSYIPHRAEIDRPILKIAGHCALVSSPLDEKIVKIISQVVRNFYPGPCDTYDAYPDATKSLVMLEFSMYFKWAEKLNMRVALEVFARIANKRIQDMLCKARRAAVKLYQTDDYQQWKEGGPPPTYSWIKRENWTVLCDRWSTEKFEEVSHRNSKNRLASGECSFSTTGSISMLVHKDRLEKKLAREPKFMELFEATHKNKKGELCSEKAKESIFKYSKLLAEKYGEDCSAYPDFDKDLWNDATGGNIHGDNYEFGALGQSRAMHHVGTTSLPNEMITPSNDVNANLDPKVVEMITKQVKRSLKKSMNKKLKRKLMKFEIKLLKKIIREGVSREVGSTSTSRRSNGKDVVVSDDSDSDSSDDSDSDSDSSDDYGTDSNSDSYSRVVESSLA